MHMHELQEVQRHSQMHISHKGYLWDEKLLPVYGAIVRPIKGLMQHRAVVLSENT